MIEYETFLTIFHLLGVIVGMGGAFATDLIFFSSVKDERVSHTELRFMRLGSLMVWAGILLIVISGLLLFLNNPEFYLASAKFLAKMTIVAILILNGLVFHLVHLPRFSRHTSEHFPSSDEFMGAVPFLLVSGAISSTSWFSAFVLGVWRGIPYGYAEIIAVYLLVVSLAIATAVILKKRIIPHSK